MSGHSKWSSIKRQKGATDAKRGAVFTKLANQITLAAREGGGDPEMNFKLRLALDVARQSNLPKDNMERAIKRGTGELEGGRIEEITYEGFGPGGVAVLIQAVTDNRNRTSASVKHLLSKYGGSLGGPNTVAWMFENRGVIRISQADENLELELIDAGAIDMQRDQDGVQILTVPQDLQKVKEYLESKNIAILYAENEFVPKELTVTNDLEKIEKLIAALEDDEDISQVYTNAKF